MKKIFIVLLIAAASVSLSAQPWEDPSLRDVKPQGWLLEYLQTQKTGLTGHPEALSYPYTTKLWDGDIPRKGDHGSDWWRYEQTAYYADGLLRLGYLLDDEQMIEKAMAGIRYTLDNPRPDGSLGSGETDYAWPLAVYFRAMKAAYDVEPSEKMVKALVRNFKTYDAKYFAYRRNFMNIEGMVWCSELTGDKTLVEFADSVFRFRKEILGSGRQSRDSRVTLDFLAAHKPVEMHGVTMSEYVKLPILMYQATGNPFYKHHALTVLERIYRENGLPDGLFTSAEWLRGRYVMDSHETCNAIDMSWSLGYFLEILKETEYADMIEKIVLNAGMGSVTNDFKALQYYSSVNQFICTGTSNHNEWDTGDTWMAYRPTHQTECCAGNVHRLMPNYVARMWLRSKDGVVAALYGPSRFNYDEGFTFVEETSYPYDERITIRVEAAQAKKLALHLRIPGWCEGATLSVNGKKVKESLKAGTFFTLDRKFADGDKIVLNLPMHVERHTAHGGGVYFERGPLVYTYAIPEKWEKDTTRYEKMNGKYPADDNEFPCWNITPAGPWNYAVSADAAAEFVQTEKGPRLRLPVSPVDWELAKGPQGHPMTPDLPVAPFAKGPQEYIELVPYGLTQLRLTVFPVLYK